METITYRSIRRRKGETLSLWLAVPVGALGLVVMVVASFRSGGLTEAWSEQPVYMSIIALAFLYSLGAVAKLFLVPPPTARSTLQLGDEGLTYGDRRYRWDELSAFKLQGRWIGRNIVFAVPGEAGWLVRLQAVSVGLPQGPLVTIPDVYDARLDEIAAKLNEYRDEALGKEAGVRA